MLPQQLPPHVWSGHAALVCQWLRTDTRNACVHITCCRYAYTTGAFQSAAHMRIHKASHEQAMQALKENKVLAAR